MLYAIGVIVIISLIFWSHPFASATAPGSAGLQHNEGSNHITAITNTTLGVAHLSFVLSSSMALTCPGTKNLRHQPSQSARQARQHCPGLITERL
jgi:hypothetical protein